MQKLSIVILLTIALIGLSACASETKPKTTPTDETVISEHEGTIVGEEVKPDTVYDNTEYENVIKVLKKAMDEEKANKTAPYTLNLGKALALVAKFFKENLNKPQYEFKREDVDSYKAAAAKKFQEVIDDPLASKELKKEAQEQLGKLKGI